jgi:hypothetical protein
MGDCETCGGCDACFYRHDLAKRAVSRMVDLQRRMDGEFSGDYDKAEYELWQDVLVRELLDEARLEANQLRDELNAGINYVDIENRYPYRLFQDLEVPFVRDPD